MRFDVDEANRPDNTVETPARLRSALRPEGTVTAGHAPGLYSGAAALPAAERALAEAQGLRPSAQRVSPAVVAVERGLLCIRPVPGQMRTHRRGSP